MNNDTNNYYKNIEIPENLKDFLTGLQYSFNIKAIKLTFTSKYGAKVIISLFSTSKLGKSLNDLTKKLKLEIPNLSADDCYLFENGILGIVQTFDETNDDKANDDEGHQEKELEPRPDISIEEWGTGLNEKYGNLKTVVDRNFPDIWQTIEFALSVKNILHTKNNTLPFAGIILGPPSSSKTLGLEM